MKPDTDDEVTGTCSRRAFRGGWGRCVWTDRSRNLGVPAEWQTDCQRSEGRDNLGSGSGRESDRLRVAGKRVTNVERRGLSRVTLLVEGGRGAWMQGRLG